MTSPHAYPLRDVICPRNLGIAAMLFRCHGDGWRHRTTSTHRDVTCCRNLATVTSPYIHRNQRRYHVKMIPSKTVSRLFIDTSYPDCQITGVCCESVKYYVWSWEAEEFEMILFQLHCWKYLDLRLSTSEELCVISNKDIIGLAPFCFSGPDILLELWNYSL
jgi:hypothetical protein